MKAHLIDLMRAADPLQGRNVAREYLQARILGILQREGAMVPLAFQGGTCLRFLFNLPRYSEDLDLTLEGDPAVYDLRRWLAAVRAQLSREGYAVGLAVRDRNPVHSA
ncbi:MAG: nucleotidyl transferase AbiEii/AbiGii toxin family protein, partial [Deltaproteobacteria bacterium]|nr:nucleotidyl transferase AbiEii/AbiGii toxin family protein [Deltaproteobacteria bacterium]